MQHDRDTRGAAEWTSAEVADLVDVAERLHRLARPLLYEAMHQQALLRTVREFSADTPIHDLARAMADNALRRALRSGAPAQALASEGARRDPSGWQFAYNLALAELAEDAARDLCGLARLRRQGNGWDA
jgi:hypothetical protein